MSGCVSCGMVEGYSDDIPSEFANNLPQSGYAGEQKSPAFHNYMKSECTYAAQPCMYTAQGELVCPKEGLGNCEAKGDQKFLGLL